MWQHPFGYIGAWGLGIDPVTNEQWVPPLAVNDGNHDSDNFPLESQPTMAGVGIGLGCDRSPSRASAYALPLVAANLLLTVLAGAPVSAPFAQSAWPNPTTRGSIAITVSTAPQEDASLAFDQTHWPNPTRRPLLHPSWTDRLNLPLASVVPVPFNQEDWPNPQRGSGSLDVSADTRPAEDSVVPFAQTDWPLRYALKRSQVGQTHARPSFYAEPEPMPAGQSIQPTGLRAVSTAFAFLHTQPVWSRGIDALTTPFEQTEWANPVGRPRREISQVVTGTLGLSTPSVADPVAGRTDPVPVPARVSAARLTFVTDGSLRTTLSSVIPVPFAQTEWPNPQRAGGLLDVTADTRPAEDAVTPFAQTDWPGRFAPRRTTADLTGARPFFYSEGVVAAPFTQTEWVNPRRGRSRLLISGAPQPTDDAVTPNVSSAWPVPVRLRAAGVSVIQARPAFYTEPGAPFAQSAWPNPSRQGRVPPLPGIPSAPLAVLTFTPEALPPPTTVWPNPPRKPISPLGWRDYISIDDTAPLVGPPLPNPVRRPPVALVIDAPSMLVTTLSVVQAQPTNQTAWPVPGRVGRRTETLTHIDGRFLDAVDGPAFDQTDWPNPARRPARAEVSWAVGDIRLLSLPTAPPFTQTEWPNPRPTPIRIDTRTETDHRFLGAVDASPANQTDWPNPVRPVVRADVAWVVGEIRLVTLPEPPPFAQTDWPNPRIGGRNPVAVADSNVTLLDTPIIKPFDQADWPVWLPVRRAITSRTHTQSRVLGIVEIQPFAQTEWPLPLRAWRRKEFLSHLVDVQRLPATMPRVRTTEVVSLLDGRTVDTSMEDHTVFSWLDSRDLDLAD